MIKEEKTTRTVTTTIRTFICDECGNKTKTSGIFKKCELCDGLFCRKCLIMFNWDILTRNDYDGDYPNYMCESCWKKGYVYREEILEVRKEAERRESDLTEGWEFVCKGNNIKGAKSD